MPPLIYAHSVVLNGSRYIPDFALRAFGLVARSAVNLSHSTGFAVPMVLKALGDAGDNILGETFYSQGALRFGEYVARLSAVPVSESVLRLTGKPAYKDDNTLLQSVVEFFRENSAEYELRAQLCYRSAANPGRGCLDRLARGHFAASAAGANHVSVSSGRQPSAARLFRRVLSFDPWRCLAGSSAAGLHHAPSQGGLSRIAHFSATKRTSSLWTEPRTSRTFRTDFRSARHP